jgi:ABC-type lipoprotein release transport system permease subunit
MLLTYVRRELRGRLRQTVIVAIGLALAVALILAVTAASSGVRDAQSSVLGAIYGVGTDITVTEAQTPGQGNNQQFNFAGQAPGSTSSNSTTNVSSNALRTNPGTAAFQDTAVTTVSRTAGVAQVAATLVLRQTTFSGALAGQNLDDLRSQFRADRRSGVITGPSGFTGFGGGNFNVSNTSVEGVLPGAAALGPLSGATVTGGRGFTAADATADVAILSKSYADTNKLAVGGTVTVKDTSMKIVGVLNAATSGTSLSDIYVPLGVAQGLSGLTGQVTNVYVKASSSGSVDSAAAAIRKSLPTATVQTQSDLASNVSGSLSSASSLVKNLGTWLSVAVLAAAFLLAILFTISGVTRRTRDFGTLKAIGWSNGRIVRQVGAESLVQGAIGGIVGLGVGLLGILWINKSNIKLTGTTGTANTAAATARRAAFGGGGGGYGGPFGGGNGGGFGAPAGGGGTGGAARRSATDSVDVILHAHVSWDIILLGIGLALVGGLLAGMFGGWRASRLRPAAALRSLD